MKSNAFYAPETVQELIEVLKLKKEGRDFYFVAGATDFAIHIKKHGIMDYTAIDLTHLDELKRIEAREGFVEIGAAATMARLEESDILRSHGNALAEAAGRVGSTQIRNRATIGGNIVNASQSADTVTASCALGATVVLLNSEGELRELPLEEFIIGIGHTQINSDEVLVKVRIPYGRKPEYSSFSKIGSRKSVAISKINCAAKIIFKDNCVAEATMYFGSIGPKAIKAAVMEKHCIGRAWDEKLLAELLELGSLQVDQAIPTRPSRYYKRIAVKGVISDVFNDIAGQREVI
ncbi:MAG TPA: FAD binding domain-containing protein [Bacillota bacterium]|nr:FAD binding domain-containing protein [Bacillota bacterium]HQE66902.1 FAD binding domain-containing protein [Bacillota bacterium]HQI15727.1 FAD binding domain-containing protein [Bacillota bacterium]HQJ36613.1 FAD binding domain-containing protein [Bacillota bacterium]HQL36912.1 FAD binding domain-containing protein [Bacillota bacterium]